MKAVSVCVCVAPYTGLWYLLYICIYVHIEVRTTHARVRLIRRLMVYVLVITTRLSGAATGLTSSTAFKDDKMGKCLAKCKNSGDVSTDLRGNIFNLFCEPEIAEL